MSHKKEVPLISVVTVSFNPGELLKTTMDSVLEQTYANLEWIVVDGGSTDGTAAFLEAQRSRIDHLLIEPDRGIYDAMNKGMELATGDFILFLNCGDQLLHNRVLDRVAASIADDTRILSTDFTTVITPKSREGAHIHTSPCTLNFLKKDFNACHQAIYVHRSLWAPFDLEYSLLADYKWVVEAARQASDQAVVYLPESTVAYLVGGASAKHIARNFKERYRLHRELFGRMQVLKNLPNYVRRVLREVKHALLRT